MSEARYRLLGGPGSPYSLKVRAVLRYRHLPHLWIVPQGPVGASPELRLAGKGMLPVMQIPEGAYWADSTPILYALETRHPGRRSILPPDPADAFLAHLIEDFADELLFMVLFESRWANAADRSFCARRQISGWVGTMPKAPFEAMVSAFDARQTKLLASYGDLDSNRAFLDALYVRVLDAIESLVTESRHLFGSRPSIADFGLYGQLSQLAIDPTGSATMKALAPRAFQWVQDLDDASGVDGEWRATGSQAPAALDALLDLIAKTFLPYLAAHVRGLRDGLDEVVLEGFGHPLRVRPKKYRQRCLLWLKAELAALDPGARARVRRALNDDAAWTILQPAAGELPAPPHVPL